MGMAITEPDAGSDVSSVSTLARRVNDRYVINGNKMFITNGSIADFLIILCVTNENEKVRSRRHSAILVETNRKGFEANQLKRKLGVNAKGYQTFGKIFDIDDEEKLIEITLNPPQQQYSAH